MFKTIFPIIKKDVITYFRLPLFWIVISLSIAYTSLLMSLNFLNYSSNFYTLLINFKFSLVLIIPFVTMQGFAAERENGTDLYYYSGALPFINIVLAKFLAAYFLYLIFIMLSLANLFTHILLGGLMDIRILFEYLNIIFLGLAYISIAIFISLRSSTVFSSVIISAFVILAFHLLSLFASVMAVSISSLLKYIDVFNWITPAQDVQVARYVVDVIGKINPAGQLSELGIGRVDVLGYLYLLSLAILFIFLATIAMKKRRYA